MGKPEEKEALDIFGRLLMEARDSAIVQWDKLISGSGGSYPPWDRLLETAPGLTEEQREVLRKALPHIVDTVLYCLLAEFDCTQRVRLSVQTSQGIIDELPRHSWGFTAEPYGEEGWLARFSKQRFEQPI